MSCAFCKKKSVTNIGGFPVFFSDSLVCQLKSYRIDKIYSFNFSTKKYLQEQVFMGNSNDKKFKGYN